MHVCWSVDCEDGGRFGFPEFRLRTYQHCLFSAGQNMVILQSRRPEERLPIRRPRLSALSEHRSRGP